MERMVSLLRHESSFLRGRLNEHERIDAAKQVSELAASNKSLAERIKHLEQHIDDQETLIAELEAARSDLRRVLDKIGRTPLAAVFRRWPGYRLMEERWCR